jgi:uncharacterized membrane protein
MTRHEWVMKRNCSLAPRQLAFACALPCLMSFVIAGVFVVFHGAWCVLGYAMLETVVTALAFVIHARHVADQEHIALTDGCLLIGRIEAGRLEQTRLDPYWTRIALPSRSRGLIRLEAKGVQIDIGRFVTEAKRRQVAQELRQALENALSPGMAVELQRSYRMS